MSAFEALVVLAGALSGTALGVFGLATLQAARRPRVLALLYHRVAAREVWARTTGVERVFALPADAFEAQIAWLARSGWTFVGAEAVARFARGEGALPDRSVVVTVDDGCASAHSAIQPTIARHGATAVLFVTTDPGSPVFRLGEGERRVTDDELRALAAAGLEIGSHAVTHRALSGLDDAEVRRELRESKRELERVVGRPVTHFAVPANWWDARVLRLAREEGYTAVWCSRPDGVRAGMGSFALPRVNVEGGLDLAAFQRAVSPAGIAQRRVVMALRAAPKRLVGPRAWTALRRHVFSVLPGHWLSPRRMAAGLGALVCAGALLSLAWWLVRG